MPSSCRSGPGGCLRQPHRWGKLSSPIVFIWLQISGPSRFAASADAMVLARSSTVAPSLRSALADLNLLESRLIFLELVEFELKRDRAGGELCRATSRSEPSARHDPQRTRACSTKPSRLAGPTCSPPSADRSRASHAEPPVVTVSPIAPAAPWRMPPW